MHTQIEAVILMKRFVLLHVNGALSFAFLLELSIFLGFLLDLKLGWGINCVYWDLVLVWLVLVDDIKYTCVIPE